MLDKANHLPHDRGVMPSCRQVTRPKHLSPPAAHEPQPGVPVAPVRQTWHGPPSDAQHLPLHAQHGPTGRGTGSVLSAPGRRLPLRFSRHCPDEAGATGLVSIPGAHAASLMQQETFSCMAFSLSRVARVAAPPPRLRSPAGTLSRAVSASDFSFLSDSMSRPARASDALSSASFILASSSSARLTSSSARSWLCRTSDSDSNRPSSSCLSLVNFSRRLAF